MTQPTPEVENSDLDTRAEADAQPRASKFWLGEVAAAQKRDKTWGKRATSVVARFRDERDMDRDRKTGERRSNILWSNTEILKSALFQGLSNPDVRRRFPKKGKDGRVARTAALVLERALATCADSYDGDSQIESAVEDMLLPGRGTAWIVYEAEVSAVATGEMDDADGEDVHADTQPQAAPRGAGPRPNGMGLLPTGGGTGNGPAGGMAPGGDYGAAQQSNPDTQGDGAQGEEEITHQSVRIDHVYWEDYLCSAGRKDSDVWWKARGHNYSRDELNKYWPAHAAKIPLDVRVGGFDTRKSRNRDGEDNDTFKRARVWEIWDKSKKERVFVADGYDCELARESDPYSLKDFYPTVEPLYGVKTTSSLTPIPEFTLYQDQADELDELTTRMSRMIANLKRRGVYDASLEGPDNQLSGIALLGDDQFLPYRGMAAMMEKGGLKGAFQIEDLVPTIQVVDSLMKREASLVQKIYEVTGISDVIRGASAAGQTATEVRVKGQFGSLRLQKRQKRVQVFIKGLYRLKSEIMAEHFTREMLAQMSGIDLPTQAEIDAARQQIAAIQQQMQMAQQSQQAMAAYQQQMQQMQAPQMGHNGGPPMPPMNGPAPPPTQAGPAPSPVGGPPPGHGGPPASQPMPQGMAPQGAGPQAPPPPPQVIPMPQIDPEHIQELMETAKAVAWEDVAAILRSDERRSYKVDVETEATAQVDEDAEKSSRIEFLNSMQGFMERIMPMVMQFPMLAAMAKESLMFAVGAFKVGRSMEEVFGDAFDQLQQQAEKAAASGPQEDPKAAAELKKIEAETAAIGVRANADIAMTRERHQADLALKQQDVAAGAAEAQTTAQSNALAAQAEIHGHQTELAVTQQKGELEMAQLAQKAASDRAELAGKLHKSHVDAQVATHEATTQATSDLQAAALAAWERTQELHHAEAAHNQKLEHAEAARRQALAHADDAARQKAAHAATEPRPGPNGAAH